MISNAMRFADAMKLAKINPDVTRILKALRSPPLDGLGYRDTCQQIIAVPEEFYGYSRDKALQTSGISICTGIAGLAPMGLFLAHISINSAGNIEEMLLRLEKELGLPWRSSMLTCRDALPYVSEAKDLLRQRGALRVYDNRSSSKIIGFGIDRNGVYLPETYVNGSTLYGRMEFDFNFGTPTTSFGKMMCINDMPSSTELYEKRVAEVAEEKRKIRELMNKKLTSSSS